MATALSPAWAYRLRPVPHYADFDFGLEIARRYLGFAAQAVQLLGAVAADPRRAVPIAEEAGIDVGTFGGFEDLSWLWRAVDASRDQRIGRALQVARGLLRAEGCWDPAQIPANLLNGASMHWSDEGLAALATSYPFLTDNVLYHARRTLRLRAQLRQAEALYEQAVQALRDTEPSLSPVALPAAPAGRQTIVFGPVRFASRRRRNRRHAARA